tara:strand:+ start:1170 stop:1367 length:198 start_codon:yes stop_codon:yes gene_type:complete
MNMIFTLLYILSGLVLFIMGLLAYMQTDLHLNIGIILGIVGVLVFIKGAIRMSDINTTTNKKDGR